MNIEVVATGTELLKGSAVNSNLAAIGRMLHEIGFTVTRGQIVGDSREELIDAFYRAAGDAELVIVTGGLGPTSDDLTREVAAEFFGLELKRSKLLADRLRSYYRRRHGAGPIPKGLFRQADVPAGARILANPVGSAPGLYFSARYAGRERHILLLPGPPAEMEPMFEEALELLEKQFSAEDRRHTVSFLVAGGPELAVQTRLEPVMKKHRVELAYCAGAEGTKVFLSGPAGELLDQAVEEARRLFHPDALPAGHTNLAAEVVAELGRRQKLLAVAESCTGGLISAAITDIPGASAVLLGGIVAYDNRIKKEFLDVPAELLKRFGAVSAEVAAAMAEGVRRRFNADIGVAVTGIAGPGGGSETKPVGLVYVAVATVRDTETIQLNARGTRTSIRARARAAALLQLHKILNR